MYASERAAAKYRLVAGGWWGRGGGVVRTGADGISHMTYLSQTLKTSALNALSTSVRVLECAHMVYVMTHHKDSATHVVHICLGMISHHMGNALHWVFQAQQCYADALFYCKAAAL